jgi:hypothetical protein
VGTAVIEKTRIVTDKNGSHTVKRVEVGLNPSDIDDIYKHEKDKIVS